MKKIIAVATLLLLGTISLFAQKSVAEQINDIKRSRSYLYGEATMKTQEEAKETALELLELEVERYVSEKKKLKNAENVVIREIKNNVESLDMKRGTMFRVFLYVKKSDVIPINDAENTVTIDREADKQEESQAVSGNDTRPVTSPVLSPKEEALQRIVSLVQFSEARDCFVDLKSKGIIKEYGKYSTMKDGNQSYLLVYNREGIIEAVLSPGGDIRKNIKTGKTQKTKVGLCLTTEDDIESLNYDSGWTVMGLPDIILVSDKFIDELADEKWVSKISVKCDPEDETAVSSEIKNLALNSKCVPSKSHIESKSETIKSFKSAIFSMKVLTIGISFVLLLIGIVNFINVMLVGLLTRKNEFAVMESIGMTKRQVYKLLAYEGIYYGGFVVLLILTVGNAVIFAIGNLSTKLADYAIFNYPYLIVSLVIVLILIICVSVPIAAYKYVSEKSIIERLREDN